MTREVPSTQAEAVVMAQVAGRFDQARESLQATLSSLKAEVESVQSHFQGRGGTSFQQVSLAWAADQERLLRALAETANAIRTAGRDYTATDETSADRMKVAKITLPL
ncbi:MAG TPA: WXG100 family type VII secretion target [Micromonosporaceae bacterium]